MVGLITISYVGYALAEARFYQADQARQFEQALKSTNLARAESSEIAGREGSTLGRIEISRMGLTAMIMEGTDDVTLQHAVGHVSGTSLPGQGGNIALAAHRDTFFRSLRDIRIGDEITLTALNGIHRYRVVSTKVVAPDDTKVLDATSDDILTLVTCYPFSFVGAAPKRFIVCASRLPE